MKDTRPNIVMLVTDHQVWRHHSPIMPNFDRFREEGVSFDNAACTTPLCGPVRRTLLTGLYPHNHRNLYNQTPAEFIEDTYLDALWRNGYRNYEFGKWHAGTGTALDHHAEGFSIPDYGNPYTTDTYRKYLERNGLESARHDIFRVFPNDGTSKQFPRLKDGEKDYECNGTWCGEQAVGLTVTPKETHESFFLSSLACEQLEELSKDDSDAPFSLRVDFWGPHHPFFPTKEYLDMYKDVDFPEYPNYRDNLDNKPKTYRHMNRPIADENGNMIIPSIFSWNEWSEMLKYVYAQSTMIDDAAGMIIKTLDSLKFNRETIVIWTSDHGDAFASHGGMFDKGSFMTEEITRIPMVMRIPGFKGHRDAMVGSIDIAPTILDYAGTTMGNRIDGTSLRPIIEGSRADVRNGIMLETYGQGYRDKTYARALVRKRWKYITTRNDIDELYDLENDPYELNNLAKNHEYADIISEMESELQTIATNTGDKDYPWKI